MTRIVSNLGFASRGHNGPLRTGFLALWLPMLRSWFAARVPK